MVSNANAAFTFEGRVTTRSPERHTVNWLYIGSCKAVFF